MTPPPGEAPHLSPRTVTYLNPAVGSLASRKLDWFSALSQAHHKSVIY